MTAFVEAVWAVTAELAPWLLLGAAIAGALHVLLPTGFVKRAFVGRRGVLTAVLLGVPLPLCSCGVIPAGLGLKKDGASDGATVGFLISTPQTGVDSVLVAASFLGWPFALFKVFAAALTGIAGGWLTDGVSQDHAVAPAESSPSPSAKPRTFSAAWEHGLDVLQSIWGWLVFGVLASAFITTVIPPQWMASVGERGELLALAIALVVSLPLYVCATASVPIAAALVAGGFPAGAALVFLMAGPATNLATLGAVYRGLGQRATLVYLGTIVLGSVGLALAFDALFTLPPGTAHVHAHGSAWWQQASAALLLGAIAWFALTDLRTWIASRSSATPIATSLEVRVEGMTCQGCVRKLQRTLSADGRVEHSEVELEPGTARVRGDLDVTALGELVRSAGFEPR